MEGLDPCVGIGLLIRNGRDLREIEEAFQGEEVGKLAVVAVGGEGV